MSVTLSRKCSLADSLLQQMFIVRFLGSMAVKTDDTTEVIYEAMRQVLAARAIHNIFRMTESHLMVTSQMLRYMRFLSDFLIASSAPSEGTFPHLQLITRAFGWIKCPFRFCKMYWVEDAPLMII